MSAERPGDGEGSWSGERGKGDRAAGFDVDGGVGEVESATARVLEGESEGEMVGVSASEAEPSSKREKSDDEAAYVGSKEDQDVRTRSHAEESQRTYMSLSP